MDARLTRRDLLLRGAAGLVAVSPPARALMRPGAALAASRCAVGAYTNPRNVLLSTAAAGAETAALERLLGRRLDIVSTFVAWDEPFPNVGHVADRDAGRTPLIAWDAGVRLGAVPDGVHDDVIRRRAADSRAFAAPILLRWGAEFNGPWNASFGKQREFVAAWRHIVDLFRRAGATNVEWVWCPYAAIDHGARPQAWAGYYPGDEYVDRVGMDGYNWGTSRSWSRWQAFGEIFTPLYTAYAQRKPVMICETASAEAGGSKAAWIADMGRQLAGPLSRVDALVWFDADKETDWRVDSSPASLAAFRRVLASPRYRS